MLLWLIHRFHSETKSRSPYAGYPTKRDAEISKGKHRGNGLF